MYYIQKRFYCIETWLTVLQMLLNLHKKSWMEGLTLQDYSEHCKHNETIVKEMLELAKNYNKVAIPQFRVKHETRSIVLIIHAVIL